MPEAGLEPACPFGHGILSAARKPNFATPAQNAFYGSALGTHKGVEESDVLFASD